MAQILVEKRVVAFDIGLWFADEAQRLRRVDHSLIAGRSLPFRTVPASREPPQVRITAHTVAAHVQPQSIPAGNAIKSSREERPKLFVDLRIILFGHHAHPGL